MVFFISICTVGFFINSRFLISTKDSNLLIKFCNTSIESDWPVTRIESFKLLSDITVKFWRTGTVLISSLIPSFEIFFF